MFAIVTNQKTNKPPSKAQPSLQPIVDFKGYVFCSSPRLALDEDLLQRIRVPSAAWTRHVKTQYLP